MYTVKVVSPDRQLCQSFRPVKVTAQSGYLASVVSADTGCGTADSPWLIQLQPGQRINVTLLDFAVSSTTGPTAGRTSGDVRTGGAEVITPDPDPDGPKVPEQYSLFYALRLK